MNTRPSTYEQITVDSTAGGVAIAEATIHPDGKPQMNYFVCIVETAAIRYRTDGTGPTASIGMPLAVGDSIEIQSAEEATRIRFIAQAGNGKLNVEGYRSKLVGVI